MLPLVLAAAVAASPVPSPSATAVPASALKEIVNVTAVNPYCASFYRHFNAVVRPIVANDLTLDGVSVSLDEVDSLFSTNNWEQRFYDERLRMERYVASMQENDVVAQREVNALREGMKNSADPVRQRQMHALAQEVQRAVDKQKQMTTDLLGVVHAMIDFNIDPEKAAMAPIGNFSMEELEMPKDAKDIKSYLRFNGMRDVLRDAELKSATLATDILNDGCK